ncbi:MAG: ATP-binding protein [Gammaproteobacteria bacterium]
MTTELYSTGFRNLFASFSLSDSTSTARQALSLLLLIRTFVTLLGGIGLILYSAYSGLRIPITPITLVFIGIFISVSLGIWRLSSARVISNAELFVHLTVDVLFLVLMLVTVGGASNPLISYLLVLLAVGATFLTRAQANLFALGSILVYTSFIWLDLRSDHQEGDPMMSFQVHLVGMWAIFVVCAILISVFVTRMASTIRERELTLAKARENEMRNEQLVAIGTLAAGTAHALGTPLSTMAVLLTEMDKLSVEQVGNEELKEDITLLRQQVQRCKHSLTQLTNYYNKEFDTSEDKISLGDFVDGIKDYITNIHPSSKIHFAVSEIDQPFLMVRDPNINHALINIIENGIKAARTETRVIFRVLREAGTQVEISVQDDGPGVPEQVMERMGEPFISTREDSMGLGIYLANATLQKAGGSIEMFNRKTGGAQTVIRLPVRSPD